jgi:sulfur-carrier protein adenylyltransferase/sulfurtransferase
MTRFLVACAEVEAWLASLGPSYEILTPEALSKLYPNRGCAAGWRLRVAFSDKERRLDLLLPVGFPWEPPRVALVDAPPFLTWPHVEKDNVLCVVPNTSEIDPDRPADVVVSMLSKAEQMIGDLISGKCDADFSDEFLSYWSWASGDGNPIISILRPEGPARTVALWRGKNYYLLAENMDDLRIWLTNRHHNRPEIVDGSKAVLAWLGETPTPEHYPATGTALRSFIAKRNPEANVLIDKIAGEGADRAVVVLGFDTSNGPALAGVYVSPPVKPKYGPRDPVSKGFRPGKVPDSIRLARFFGGQAIVRRSIERADAAWIHGRGEDLRARRLRELRIVVLGCGSLGAPIAINLALAGVGHQTMVDYDTMKWANVGRHPLGASKVGQGKARALAEKLRSDFPHSQFEFLSVDIDTCVRKHTDVLVRADLIISATGSWAADRRIEEWVNIAERKVPVLYTWMEAHATSGHALLLNGEGVRLTDGFDGTGKPEFCVADWPTGTQVRQEPACGSVYQPYGPIELGLVCNLASELALDALLGNDREPTYRLWIGAGRRLNKLGGIWTTAWRSDPQFREAGGFIVDRSWTPSEKEQAA